MRHLTLKILTWATVAIAVTSALWLASGDSGLPEDDFQTSFGVLDAAG